MSVSCRGHARSARSQSRARLRWQLPRCRCQAARRRRRRSHARTMDQSCCRLAFFGTLRCGVYDLLRLTNSVELGSSRGALIELPKQPIVVGPEFFLMAVPFLRKLPVEAFEEREKRSLGRLCMFAIVHLDAR